MEVSTQCDENFIRPRARNMDARIRLHLPAKSHMGAVRTGGRRRHSDNNNELSQEERLQRVGVCEIAIKMKGAVMSLPGSMNSNTCVQALLEHESV